MVKYFVKFKYLNERGDTETIQSLVTLDILCITNMNTLRHSILYQSNINRQYEIDIISLVKLEV